MDKVLLSLGLIRKAGKLKTGVFTVVDAVKKGKAVMVLLAADISENTKKELVSKLVVANIQRETLPYTMEQLGDALGKPPCACAAITEKGFIKVYEQAKDNMGRI